MSGTIKVHDIVKELLESDSRLLSQKGHVADILDISRAESLQIFQHYNTGVFTAYDVFREFLIIWVGRQDSDKATIGLLSTLLKENGFRAAAGESIYYLKSEIYIFLIFNDNLDGSLNFDPIP